MKVASKVKAHSRSVSTNTTKPKAAPPKTRVASSSGAGPKDRVSIGVREPHQADFDKDARLKEMSRRSTSQPPASAGKPKGSTTQTIPPKTIIPEQVRCGRVTTDTPIAKTMSPGEEWALYMIEVKRTQGQRKSGSDLEAPRSKPKKYPKNRSADPKPITVENPAGNNINRTSKPNKHVPSESIPQKCGRPTDLEVPTKKGANFLQRFADGRAMAGVGLASSLYTTQDGIKDIRNGHYAGGTLKLTAGSLETYNNASDLHAAHQAVKNYKSAEQSGVKLAEETAETGFKGAKIAGKIAGGLMAAYDGKQAYDAYKRGHEVAATEHALDTVWDLAGLSGVGTAGSIAHSLTRLAMSTNINGVSGDRIVTSGIDSVMNGGLNREVAQVSKRDQGALNAFRQMNGGGMKLHAAATNKKDFARAITGLLEEISQSEEPSERQRLQFELQQLRQVQRKVRHYNRK